MEYNAIRVNCAPFAKLIQSARHWAENWRRWGRGLGRRSEMEKYPKIQTVYLRDPNNKYKTLLEGQFSIPAFEYLADNEWVFTEKVDGTNVRVSFDGEFLSFAGKTDRAQLHPGLLTALFETFYLQRFKDLFDTPMCLYGEGYGPKIQSGGKYRQEQGFVLFDVKIGEWWLERRNVENVAADLDIDVVPIVGNGTLNDMVRLARNGFRSTWGNFEAEGIVARPTVELMTRGGERIITKIKHKDFPKQ